MSISSPGINFLLNYTILSAIKEKPKDKKEEDFQKAETNPELILRDNSKHKNLPYYLELLEKAAKNAAKKYPKAALKYAYRYKDQPYAKEVMEKAAKKYPKPAKKYA